ncbi:hypothetical protein [Paraglaciecola sp. L3A3]|uniref:hypothetical protein n=1 Tax=Paraglaciecola sp. L3A3 TaxID=2686358 RepID=UPI00131E29BF|nr:hypothetical protein [Paraglaciecola sp. L3A3]
MINYIYKFTLLILVIAVGFGFLSFYKVNEYTAAIADGTKLTCSDFQKGITKYKGECWECPTGFSNHLAKMAGDPSNPKHCRKAKNYIKAERHSEPTGLLNITCKSKEVWYKNKACWTCPAGYKPARIKENKGNPQCKPKVKYIYKAANKIGEKGCPDGSWAGTLTKKCYRCPEGYKRNILKTVIDSNPTNDPKACKGEVTLMESILQSSSE